MALMNENDPLWKFRHKQGEEEIKKNPLLAMSLGDLVAELHKTYALDPNVIKPESEIPEESLSNYKKYRAIINQLNAREGKYTEIQNPVIG
jgi:hypothetical protein